MLAAEEGNTEVVRILVGFESGMTNRAGQTALMYAAQKYHSNCAILLADEVGF